MYRPVNRGCVFFGVATQAECLRSRGDQLNASNIFVDPNFVTAQTSRGDGGMDSLALRLILMTLETFRRIDVLIERNRMLLCQSWHHLDRQEEHEQVDEVGEDPTGPCFPADKNAACRRWDHYQPLHVHDPRLSDCQTTGRVRLNCKLLQQLAF